MLAIVIVTWRKVLEIKPNSIVHVVNLWQTVKPSWSYKDSGRVSRLRWKIFKLNQTNSNAGRNTTMTNVGVTIFQNRELHRRSSYDESAFYSSINITSEDLIWFQPTANGKAYLISRNRNPLLANFCIDACRDVCSVRFCDLQALVCNTGA